MNLAYNTAGRPTNTTAAGRALAYQYDSAGNRTRLTWPDGYSINTNYDALNRPLSYQEGGTVPVTTLATTTWDDLSRRATLTLGNGTTSTATYNTQGTLATLTHNLTGTTNDLGFNYTRNQIGDITVTTPLNPQSNWVLANPPEICTANGLNQYTTRNTTAITHDPNGNLQSDGIWTYGHDLDNRLTTAVRNNSAGNATAIRGYGSFGENGTTAPNRFGYTGQQYIAGLVLYYYKVRWYSPTMGRFLETDSIGYGDGVNWYAYVGNSPVNRRDPTGLFCFSRIGNRRILSLVGLIA